jgi:GPH family glycoside/pentoside/hexuronide:cation symporter
MADYETPAQDRVPLLEKAAFGSGHLVNNLIPGALGVFMFFLLTAFGMDPFLAGLLGGLPRLVDAISDPLMGYISDNTNTRWGRRRPYIFVGAILTGLMFMLLWQMNENNSQSYNFWYFLILSCLLILANTTFSTPLIGLGYEMTSDYNERTRLMGLANIVGQVAWMVVPWFWVLIADVTLFETQAEGVRTLAIIVGLIAIVFGVLPAIFSRGIDSSRIENRQEISIKNLGHMFVDLFKGMFEVFRHKPFLRLCGATFLVFNGFQIVASFSFFIILFYLFNGDYAAAGSWPAWFSTILAMITAFFVIPVVAWMAGRYGKRKAFIIATSISIVGYILKWWGFNPDNPYLMFLPLPLMAFGLGCLFTLMMSMTADICDLDELENGMPRKEGTFGAIYWWTVKLGQALALIVGGAVLSWVGFDGDAATQSLETMTKLRIADIVIPSVTAGLAILVMWNYDLSEEKAREIKAELESRRGTL